MGCTIDCPNIRYNQTKKGGFLGFGSEGYYYCSCNGAKLDWRFVSNVCKGRRDYKEGDNLQYVGVEWCDIGTGKKTTSSFIDCNQYKQNGIKN